MKNKEKGALGELIAAIYLKLKGYEILERNFLIKGGELDIIAKKGDVVAIVEVKTRTNDKFGAPKDAVDYYKRKHIGYAARCFINRDRLFDKKIRFDVIEVYLPKLKINHIEHAFEIF